MLFKRKPRIIVILTSCVEKRTEKKTDQNAVEVTLEAADIPGADLNKPFETNAMPALRWWLLCRGIKAPSSWKKQQLIDR